MCHFLRRRTLNMNLDRAWSWFAPRERIVFTGLLLLHVAFLWFFTYLPTQDGPSHLNNANVILKYFRSEYPVFREYYVLNTSVWSNWLGHGILAGLMSLFPLLVAEKVFVSGYVITFPLTVRYALRGIRPEAGVLSFLSFPLIYNYTFQYGFLEFLLQSPSFFPDPWVSGLDAGIASGSVPGRLWHPLPCCCASSTFFRS